MTLEFSCQERITCICFQVSEVLAKRMEMLWMMETVTNRMSKAGKNNHIEGHVVI